MAKTKTKPKPPQAPRTEVRHGTSFGAPCVTILGRHATLGERVLLSAVCADRNHGEEIAREWLTKNESYLPKLLGLGVPGIG